MQVHTRVLVSLLPMAGPVERLSGEEGGGRADGPEVHQPQGENPERSELLSVCDTYYPGNGSPTGTTVLHPCLHLIDNKTSVHLALPAPIHVDAAIRFNYP